MTKMSRLIAGLALLLLSGGGPASATEVRIFRQQSADDFADGEFDGLALDVDGALRLAPRFERLVQLEEPFVFAARPRGDGWLLGTGNSGRILEVGADGRTATLWSAPEPEIFALWVDDDGTAYAGSSPDGKVYRLTEEGGEVVFDPPETYIWSIARAPWGDLLVATGDGATLYAVTADGESRKLLESSEEHLRALHPLADSVLIGTAGEGLILSLDRTGGVRSLFDSDQDEVTAFADDGAGRWYAAAVAAEAALSQRASENDSNGKPESGAAEVTIEVSAAAGSSTSGPHSTVIEGGSDQVRTVASQQRQTVYSLAWIDDRLWLGTGVEGNVYSLVDGRLALEASVDDRQVVGLFAGASPVLVTTNGAALHRAVESGDEESSYVSEVLDTGGMSRFGSLRWRGDSARRGAVTFAVRSGLSAEPDATWSDWSVPAAGDALDLAALPEGRFVQWRLAVAPKAGASARVTAVEISYRQKNSSPTISRFEAMDPGQVLVPSSFSPDDQIYEPAHPNRAGIFKPLEPASSSNGSRLKTLWRSGYRTLRWSAEDPNEDALEYALEFRPLGSEHGFLPLAEGVDESYYSFDATVLPDGVYRFRLTVSDEPGNTPPTARSAERISEPVVIDHTPPMVLEVDAREGGVLVVLHDDLSPVRAAEVSIDGRDWVAVPAADGLLDGQRETLRVDIPEGARLVLLRTLDAAFNTRTYDLQEAR